METHSGCCGVCRTETHRANVHTAQHTGIIIQQLNFRERDLWGIIIAGGVERTQGGVVHFFLLSGNKQSNACWRVVALFK